MSPPTCYVRIPISRINLCLLSLSPSEFLFLVDLARHISSLRIGDNLQVERIIKDDKKRGRVLNTFHVSSDCEKEGAWH